jgi:hypothetical protein
MDPIQLDQVEITAPEVPQEQPVEISAEPQPPQLSDGAVANRVSKIQLGQPGLGRSPEELTSIMNQGNEGILRTELARNKELKDYQNSQNLVSQIAQQQGRRLTLPEIELIKSIAAKKQADPDSVIEDGYADTFMENLKATAMQNPSSDLAQAFLQAPKETEEDLSKSKDLKSKVEFVRTQLENAQAALDAQSKVGFVADLGKTFFPGYQEAKLMDFSKGGSVGTNLDRQAGDLYFMPYDKFKEKVSGISAKMINDNPQVAVQYFSALLHQSQSDRVFNNLFPLIDATGVADIANMGTAAVNRIRLLNVARKAMRSVATDPAVTVSRATVNEAAGNLKEAAIQQATEEAINVKTNPASAPSAGIKQMQSVFSGNVAGIADDPAFIGPTLTRRFSQELVNRIQERDASFYNKIISTIQHGMKINRLAGIMASEVAYRQIAEDALRRHGGLDNSLMNHIAVRDDLGQLHIETHMSADGSSLFSSESVARNFIRNHGLGDVAHVVEAEGPGKLQSVPVAGTGTKGERPKLIRGRDSFSEDRSTPRFESDTGTVTGDAVGPAGEKGTKTFKTTKGSTYEVNADGTTTRNKSFHPEHGRKDVGPQPKSDKTFYVTLDEAQALGEFQTTGAGKQLARLPDGRWGVKYTDGPGKGKFERRTLVKPKSDPAVGLLPVEIWNKGTKVHFGNKITEVTEHSASAAIRDIDERIGAQVNLPKPMQTAQVAQKGAGFYVVIKTPVNETRPVVRSLLLSTAEARTPDSMFNAFGGYLGAARTPEDTLSVAQMIARKVATFGPSNYHVAIKENLDEIRQLRSSVPGSTRREVWKEWNKIMEASKKIPDHQGELGSYPFRSIGELSGLYMNNAGRLPTEAEVAASFALKRADEVQKALQNIREFKRLSRLGAKSVNFTALDVANATEKSTPTRSVQVNAVPVLELPTGDRNILVMGQHVGEERISNAANIFPGAGPDNPKTKFAQAIKNGEFRIYKLPNPELRPFRGFGSVADEYIQYVVAANAKEADLNYSHLNVSRAPTYDYDHYISQAIVYNDKISKQAVYEGDRTIAAFNVRAMGKDVAERLDKIRTFLNNGDETGAYTYYRDSGLDQEWGEIKGWFDSGRLSKTEPIKLVPRGKMILDLDKDMNRRFPKFFDGTRENYGLLVDNKRDPYDVFTYRNEGTKANPLYKQSPVKEINHLTVMNRGMSKAVNGMFMDDYKVSSIEHWMQEAKNYLDVKDSNLASAPAYHFYNSVNPSSWKSGTKPEIINNLMTANYQIKQFLGVQDQTTTWFHSFAQSMADSVYNNVSTKFDGRLVPDNVLHFVRDPFQALRSFAFHTKLGLFAVPQLIVQMQSFALILGVSGTKYAAPGAKAALFHSWLRINQTPELLAHLDNLATRKLIPGTSNWKAGELTEAHALLSNSGFEHVGNEHIYRDASNYHDFIGSKLDGILNMGAFFFREGERMTRTAAFYTAYREIRDLHPTGKMTEELGQQILNRADLLSSNMSRASASALHKGVFSTTSTFLSYQLRNMELVLGKRLTNPEKARLFGTYAALYGVPGAFGLSGLPIGALINSWAQEAGYVPGPDNNFINSMVTEGVPATILALATGNNYNIQERYSNPDGLAPIATMLKGDKTFLETIGGAPYSIMSQALANTDGFYRMMVDQITGEGDFKFKVEDILDPLKTVASVSAGAKLYAAVTTGRLLSNNEGYLGDVSTANAIFMAATGLSPKESASMITMGWTRKEEKDKQAGALSAYVKEMRRGFQAQADKNYDQALDYFKRGNNILRGAGFPEERYKEAFAIAAQGWQSITAHATWDYYTRNVPENRKGIAQEALPRALKNTQGQ